eukprot:1601596-Prymnesium_polylepis.1
MQRVDSLVSSVFWRVEVDLRELAIEAVADGLVWPVGGEVADLQVDGASCDSVDSHVAVEQRGGQRRVEAAE